jgi:sorbitol/mannitol transport system substrate-binding protein
MAVDRATTILTRRQTVKFRLASVLTAALFSAGMAQAATELVIATVNNGHMIEMQKLGKNFEAANPDIKLKWVTLEEGVLRQRVTTDTPPRVASSTS